MIQGGCLCGGVRFEIEQASGPFELCHCSRCRKVTGSAFMAGVGVRRMAFTLLKGADLIRSYEAPLLEAPPPYRVFFCGTCGCPLPDATGTSPWLEIPAGLLDGDPGVRPDRHIFVDLKSSWFPITDDLPQLDKAALIRHRRDSGVADRS